MECRWFCYCLVFLAGMPCCCVIASDWPEGYYGLPMANTGCPKDATFDWKRGWIYQDTEDNNPANDQSNSFHLEGRVGKSTVNRSFCMKTQINNDHQRPLWPAGTYCIYQRSNNCPLGFRSPGFITWDDENMNNTNQEKGSLPKVYLQNSDTTVYFCCRKDGYMTNPIDLPTRSPFYLLMHKYLSCQQVKWAVSTREWIKYDTEDDDNHDYVSHYTAPYVQQGYDGYGNMKIFYCYYTSCQYTLNASGGTIDFPTHSGNYANGQLCSWRITVKAGQFIEVRFTKFQLSDVNDQLIFYDGEDESAPLLATLYGNAQSDLSSRTIYSSSANLFMVFRSNHVNTASGFKALYTALGTAVTDPPTTFSTTERLTTRAEETTTQPSTRITTEKPEKTNPTEIAPLSRNPSSKSSPEPSSLPNVNFSKNIGEFKKACVQQSQSALTSVAIVIPLICMIAVIVMAAYLVYRLRKLREKSSDVSVRYTTESVNNPAYVPSDAVIEARTSGTNVLYEDSEGDIYHEVKPKSERQATDNPLYQSTDDDKHVYASFA